MQECGVKSEFNSLSSKEAIALIQSAIASGTSMRNDNGERLMTIESDMNTVKDKIIDVLQVNNTWNEGSSKDKLIRLIEQVLSPAIEKAKNPIVSNNYRKLLNLLRQEINITTNEQEDIPEDTNTEEVTNPENSDEYKNSQDIKEFEKSIYGTAQGARSYRTTLFQRDLAKMCIVDLESEVIINNNDDLNAAIVNFKNQYYKNILKFLESEHLKSEVFPEEMFVDGELQSNYIQTLNAFYRYLKDNEEGLSAKIRTSWNDNIKGKTSPLYDAVNSYVNLFYFDNLIKDQLGKTIAIAKDFVGFEVDADFNKYSFSDMAAEMAQGWETAEFRNALDDIGKFSSLLIQSIPLLDRNTNKRAPYNVNMVNFTNAFTALSRVIQYKNSTRWPIASTNIIEYFERRHDNVDLYTGKILEELFKVRKGKTSFRYIDSFIGKNMLNFVDANVLYSVYKYVYADEDSIKELESDKLRENFSNGQYPLVQCVSGVIDRTMSMDYMETIVDNSGKTHTTIKKKAYTRQREYNIRNSINMQVISRDTSKRQDLQDKYNVEVFLDQDGKETWTFKIGGQSYRLSSSSSGKSVLNANELTVSREGDSPTIPSINLGNEEIVRELTEGRNQDLREELLEFKNILTFIEENLFTTNTLLSENGLDRLLIMESYSPESIRNLFAAAARAAIVNKIYLDYNNLFDSGEVSYNFQTYLGIKYSELNYRNITEESVKRNLFTQGKGTINLLAVPISSKWVEDYVDADATLSGDISKAVTKDLFGSSIPNYSISFMGGNMPYYIKQSKENLISSAHSKLLFAQQSDMLSGVVVNTDSEAKSGVKKNVRNMKTGELLYQAIFHNFWGTFLADSDNYFSKHYVTQPTTYSDKVKIISYMTNATKQLLPKMGGRTGRSYSGKTISELTNDDIIYLYGDTIGDFYKQVYTNVLNDYAKMFGITPTIEAVVAKLQEINATSIENLSKTYNIPTLKSREDLITTLAQRNGVNLQLYSSYRVEGSEENDKIKFNELLDYYANYLYVEDSNGYTNLRNKLLSEKINFVNDFLNSNTILYLRNYDNTNSVIGQIIEELFPTTYNQETKYDFATLCYPDAVAKENLYYRYTQEWVKDGKLIIAKTINEDGYEVDHLYGNLISDNDTTLILNPLIEKYFMTDSMLANNLRLMLTGSEIAHPAKAKNVVQQDVSDRLLNGFTTEYLTNIKTVESATQGAQLKRNVIIPATLQYVQQNTLNGVAKKLRIAVFKDIKANVFNFRGDFKEIDSGDGAAYTTMFQSILENFSLQDQKVGENKKSIMHANTYLTGGAVLGKWATFALSNELISKSLAANVDLYNLFKKLTNIQWNINGMVNSEFIDFSKMNGQTVDLIKGRGLHTRSSLNFTQDILRGKQLFYEDYSFKNGRRSIVKKQILDFGKDNNGVYYTKEQNVTILYGRGVTTLGPSHIIYHLYDANSNHIKLTEDQYKKLSEQELASYHTINSLFELHAAMGGLNSVEIEDGDWIISEASNYAVVNFMNNVSVRQDKNKTDLFNQDNYYQPLKDAQIAYAANNSSIKNGVSNINESSSWTDNNSLKYMTITSDGLGVQMDADHEADEALLTEFSQVISALDSGGKLHYLARQAYKDLGSIALQASEVELDALQTFIDNLHTKGKPEAISQLYDIIGRTIINNYKQNNQSNLADEIIDNISTHFDENFSHELDSLKIPFSDPGIYSKMLSTFVSVINKKSVKRKYPGSGYVMAPSYGFMQLWDINGSPHQMDDIFNLAFKDAPPKGDKESFTSYKRRIVQEYLEKLQESQIAKDRSSFSPTEKVRVVITDKKGIKYQVQLNLDSPTDYVTFKSDYWQLLLLDPKKYNKTIQGTLITSAMLEGATVQFFNDITVGRDLAPARITWKHANDTRTYNVFDEQPIRDSFTGKLYYTYSKEENPKDWKYIVIPAEWASNYKKGKWTPDQLFKQLKIKTTKRVRTEVNTPNRAKIQQVFDDLYSGTINGKEVLDLDVKAAEIIMSSMHRSKYPTHTSLANTLSNFKNFKLSFNREVNIPNNYDVAFVKQNGKHAYLTFNNVVSDINDINSPQEIEWKHIKPIAETDKSGQLIDNKATIYAIDKDSTLLFPIGVAEVNESLEWNKDGQVVNKEGEIQQGKYLKGKNGRVLEVTYFVKRYSLLQNTKTKDGRVKKTKHLLYKVDAKALKKLGKNHQYLADVVSRIYAQESYSEFRLNINRTINNDLKGIIPKLSFSNPNLSSLINNTLTKLIKGDTIDRQAYQKAIFEYSGRLNQAMQTSFRRQLEVTASRIPAQTLQSFMQMQCVGYIQSKKNVCYVTPWQTYLQGSDYDIDKAYIMGSAIDSNGIYVGWSPLFDYSSLKTLKASELLPFSTGKILELSDIRVKEVVNKDGEVKTTEYLDITNYIKAISDYTQSLSTDYETSRTKILETQAKLLQLINDRAIGNKYKVYVNPEAGIIYKRSDKEILTGKDAILHYLRPLNNHQRYQVPSELKESAYKNSVSSKINRIVNDLRNMDSAYSPIEMEHIRPDGKNSKVMSLMNPATKFVMQVQNMVGKNVIGIAAVGEKIFFNLTYYWNEQLRANQDIEYLVFQHEYNRIEGRAYAAESLDQLNTRIKELIADGVDPEKARLRALLQIYREGRKKFNPVKIIKNKLSNVNLDFENVEQFRDLVNEINVYFEETRAELGEEIDPQSEQFQRLFHQKIRDAHNGESQTDLYISELLSAATDNAKELILAQINAGTDLAGNYLYLLTLGFEIKDIMAFMTSPTISIINSLSEFNMFNDRLEALDIQKIVKLLQGDETVLFGYKNTPISAVLLGEVNVKEGEDVPTKKELFRKYIKDRVLGIETRTAQNITQGTSAEADFIEILIAKLQQNLDQTNLERSFRNYELDLEEFATVSRRAREASNLGNIFLGMNQGLPSSKVDLLRKLRQIQSLVSTREEQLGITKGWIEKIEKELTKNSIPFTIENIKENVDFQNMVAQLIELNPALDTHYKGYIEGVLANAVFRKVPTNFNARTWLTSDASYRKAIKNYYNIIKDTWNVFDVVDKVPQFNALLKLLNFVYQADKELSLKSRAVDYIHEQLLNSGRFIDDYKSEQLLKYVDERLIVSWLENEVGYKYRIPFNEGEKYFNMNGDLQSSNSFDHKDLTTPEGRATFKYIMEKYIIPGLQNGTLKKIKVDEDGNPIQTNEAIDYLTNNKFVKGLILAQDSQGVPFYKLDIDMMAIDSTVANQEKFQDLLDALIQLKNEDYAGHPLSDWFMMYNLYVNKNQYGQDRLTTIFRPFISQISERSVIGDFYEYIGDIDYKSSDEMLERLGINMRDVNLVIAPVVRQGMERFSKEPVIKQYLDGFEVYKVRNSDGTYTEISRYPNRTLTGDVETKKDNARKTHAVEYFLMWAPNQENESYFRRKLETKDPKEILEVLAVLQSQGIITINISNCK